MSDNILEITKFDAGIQTENGYEQFSMVNTAGNLIGSREYKESFDEFKQGYQSQNSYIWNVLSAVGDQTGKVLYENIKNYIDYVTNIDLCKVQSLKSMIKLYGLDYKIFDNLEILPIEILDLINIFSINKKYILYGNTILKEYRDHLSSEGINAIYDYAGPVNEDIPISSNIINSVIDYNYGGKYYNFVVDTFINVLSGFLSLPYEENGTPIYKLQGEDGIYNELIQNRSKYTSSYQKDTKDYERRKYKMLHGVSLQFDECAALDRIENGLDSEIIYSGAKAELIQMEKEWRAKAFNNNKTSRYAFYKKSRVLEYVNFIINKYFTDHKSENLASYSYNKDYFLVGFKKGSGENAETVYADTGNQLIIFNGTNYSLDEKMIRSVAQSLADTVFYISNIREKIKLQTRKNYMKGTYDLMLYVINEFLVDYSRTNPIFRNEDVLNQDSTYTVADLLKPIYANLSSHDINNLTAIEYFDETEYFNIASETDNRSDIFGTNNRFWENPNGESLIKHSGLDSDFDINSITSFYMDTLGIRDNYISDENTLCAFLGAVFNLGAMNSFIHEISGDQTLTSSAELFGAQVEKYGKYSDDLYKDYLNLKQSWTTFTSYLSNEKYEYQISDCISAQAISAAEYIKQLIYDREFSTVSAVYNKYIKQVDEISSQVNKNIEAYNNLLSGEYSFYFNKANNYKYCFNDSAQTDYKHNYYISSDWDSGLEFLYDMLYKIGDYASGSDENGNYITNWPIYDTVEYFYNQFIDISSKYISMTTGSQLQELGLNISHNWNNEYGFVDISSVSLESELKYGYDFMTENINARKQFILDTLNNLKSQSTDLANKSQSIKNSLTQAVAQYKDGSATDMLGDSSIYAVSINKAKGDYMEDYRCKRSDSKQSGYKWVYERKIAGKTYWYYDTEKGAGDWVYDCTPIPPYRDTDGILARCNALKKYMSAPTTFYILTQDDSYHKQYNYELMDDGVYASITQIESDYIQLQNNINSLVNEINNFGFKFNLTKTDIDEQINEIVLYLNSQVDEQIVQKDSKIKDYNLYISTIIKLSAMYSPIKYEYDSIFKDSKQYTYLSEFQPDTEMTLAALTRLSSYNIDKDSNNRKNIIQSINQMKQTYQDIVMSYQDLADDLSKEYMLPQAFESYVGYIEEMLELMYNALKIDISNKTIVAQNIAQNEFDTKLYPAASMLIKCLSPYENYLQKLPNIVNKKLKELYYFDEPLYLKQKEMFLTYGGRSFCYYPYFNLKNTVHSSYQVHPFLWNFIKREQAYGIVSKTFFSVNIDELEKENIAQNWRKFYGDFGEIKYNDISKQRYPDYSGYQSRYEDSIHIAENTQFVSEVVDYDGPFYPPAIEWIRNNGIEKSISSIIDLQYNSKMATQVCTNIQELSSLEWENVLNELTWMNKYKSDSSVNVLTSNIYNKFYKNKTDLDFTKYEICNFIKQELSSDDTFYGRFYRQLRLDQNIQYKNKKYIVEQLQEYWANHSGQGPSISDITENCTIDRVHDIYKYGMDSYGNMYCLYKQYDQNIFLSAMSQDGLSYKYKQSTPGELWIRLKNHPIAFPAFSGSHPNVYIKSRNKRHAAFVNLFDLYMRDINGNLILDDNNEPIQRVENDVNNIKVSNTSCIYDFEFTKDKNNITFITQMYNNNLTCHSRDIQNYQNSWLVHCKPIYDTLTSDTEQDMSIFRLYSPTEDVDYFQSGDNYDSISQLSSLSSLDNDGCTLYQYIGSYLKGNSNIYHTYVKKHIYRDESGSIIKNVYDQIKIFPVINGKYSKTNDIIGNLIEDNNLSIIGPDVCVAYDETTNIINFAAQTILLPDTNIYTESGEICISSNADGPIINDPLNSDMNSHDIFDTNVTFFKKQVISKQLRNVNNINDLTYTFNTNADISYFPVYPGLDGIKKLYQKSEYYDFYSIELLGASKDISKEISYVNPNPDPYLNVDDILSSFANARVYQDYIEYVDETLKIINNELIGCNSKVLVKNWLEKIDVPQSVVKTDGYFIWQIGLNSIYQNLNLNNIKKLKILLFNKKCYGKNAYLFTDLIALKDNWFNLNYDSEEKITPEYSVISAADYTFGYNNRVVIQSTLNGMGNVGINDSNHIYNIKNIQARLLIDESLNSAILEFKFNLINPDLIDYTFISEDLIQAVFLDIKNLEIFNYFHYLDTYGVLRVIDYFKSIDEINENRIKSGDGWKIYSAGYNLSEEELMSRLKSYYEYKNKLIPLSSVDLSQYDCLSDVYILQGSRKLAFKQDEEFRYELTHPGYFYPTINAKFPMNPAQYMMQSISFKEDANIQDNYLNIFGQQNVFILDMEDPQIMLSSIGRIDIPIILDDTEYIFAYEDYLDVNENNIDNKRNCELYDNVDPYVLQFIQFEADAENLSDGIPVEMVNANRPFEIPDENIKNIDIETAMNKIALYIESEKYNIKGVYPVFSEQFHNKYIQEYISFTVDNYSLTEQQMLDLLRIYVNYRKYNIDGEEKIELYFNYMNYLNSPYLKIQDNKTYIDIINNTYLSLKQDEEGALDIVAQFRYYNGKIFYGYRNVKLASYQIYNISDDKPKFIIKKIDTITRNKASNENIQPISEINVCDIELNTTSVDNKNKQMEFDVIFALETNTQLKSIEFYIDYPSDFIEFIGTDTKNIITGKDWTLEILQFGYAKVIMSPTARVINIPAKTTYSVNDLIDQGDQNIILYVDNSIVIGQNNIQSQVKNGYGKITVYVEQVINKLDLLLTDQSSLNDEITVFNTKYSQSLIEGYILSK